MSANLATDDQFAADAASHSLSGSAADSPLNVSDADGARPATELAATEPLATVPAAAEEPGQKPLHAGEDEDQWESPAGWLSDQSAAFFGSLVIHVALLLLLGLVPLVAQQLPEKLEIVASPPPEDEVPVRVIEEIAYSDLPQGQIGAGGSGETENVSSTTEILMANTDLFEPPVVAPPALTVPPTESANVLVKSMLSQPLTTLDRLPQQRGRVGTGEQGAAGAVDRLTYEILQSMEERPTTVVWLFDQSGSLIRKKTEIRERFDRVYEELGLVHQARGKRMTAAERRQAPLLTSIIGFGSGVHVFTDKPTDSLDEIKQALDRMPDDASGIERPFTAIELAVDRFKSVRRTSDPESLRNVLLIVVTDERGDDVDRLESAIVACRRYGMPVYVVGAPAPFGRQHTLIKYVDPDPNFDQTARWAQVDQGPESLVPEQVQMAFSGNFQEEPVIDSGFGPYALTRLAYETGGFFITVHPNREVGRDVGRGEVAEFSADLRRFFDPQLMARYRPDYLSPQDYQKRLKASPLRSALVNAATIPAPILERPRMRFVRRSEAELARELTQAQQDAARLEPTLVRLAAILDTGRKARDEESSPRWQASFDLSLGRVLAQKVRTETYNAMLAQAKRGMPFSDPTNNTWVIAAADEITVGSRWEREAELAKELLQRVLDEHPGTPWAHLAQRELDVPLGWVWREEFTDLTPPANNPGGNNNNLNLGSNDDQRRMLARPPTRPVPKL